MAVVELGHRPMGLRSDLQNSQPPARGLWWGELLRSLVRYHSSWPRPVQSALRAEFWRWGNP